MRCASTTWPIAIPDFLEFFAITLPTIRSGRPRSCRSASNCSLVQRTSPLRRHRRPRTRRTHSGTVPSVVETCTLSNDSPPRNSCSALHRNLTAVQHEPLSATSASARASACTQSSCLIWPKLLCRQSLQPLPDLNAMLLRSLRTSKPQILPSTASASTLCTRSAPFKVHSLPLGRLPSSRCIRSARSCNCELL